LELLLTVIVSLSQSQAAVYFRFYSRCYCSSRKLERMRMFSSEAFLSERPGP